MDKIIEKKINLVILMKKKERSEKDNQDKKRIKETIYLTNSWDLIATHRILSLGQ